VDESTARAAIEASNLETHLMSHKKGSDALASPAVTETHPTRAWLIESRDYWEAEARRLEVLLTADWQPIETAPKDGGNVMLWCVDLVGGNGRVATGSWHYTYDGSWWDYHMEYTLNPTHWMPLPAPPVIGSGTE
jgi:hypothetical protein